jgi:hypothetical protein
MREMVLHFLAKEHVISLRQLEINTGLGTKEVIMILNVLMSQGKTGYLNLSKTSWRSCSSCRLKKVCSS